MLFATHMLATAGAPWSTQAVVEWMVSVQLELLRSGRSKRMTAQLSQEAGDKVAGDDSANGNGTRHNGSIAGNGRGQLLKKGTSIEQ